YGFLFSAEYALRSSLKGKRRIN
ncbi:MAG: hypothetical protein H6Q02_1536, partial [Acidobacteria bacterium]|nr:hypothetical protein [Acidobacteriota bacterium]